jgi:hypothetical protein
MSVTVPTLTDVVVESDPSLPPTPNVARMPEQRHAHVPSAPLPRVAARALPRAHSVAGIAVTAFALGALALGALAIGRLAIHRLAVGRARIARLQIDDLDIRRLHLRERPLR